MKMSSKETEEESDEKKKGVELGKYICVPRLGSLWGSVRFCIGFGVCFEHFPQRRNLPRLSTGSCHPPRDNWDWEVLAGAAERMVCSAVMYCSAIQLLHSHHFQVPNVSWRLEGPSAEKHLLHSKFGIWTWVLSSQMCWSLHGIRGDSNRIKSCTSRVSTQINVWVPAWFWRGSVEAHTLMFPSMTQ